VFRIQAPVLVVPTADANLALGVHLQAAGLAAYREIAVAAKGLEIAHLQFVFRGATLAVCSRIRHDGIVEIEMGLGDPHLPGAGRRGTTERFRANALISCRRRVVAPPIIYVLHLRPDQRRRVLPREPALGQMR
jgi:hypothetical protein